MGMLSECKHIMTIKKELIAQHPNGRRHMQFKTYQGEEDISKRDRVVNNAKARKLLVWSGSFKTELCSNNRRRIIISSGAEQNMQSFKFN